MRLLLAATAAASAMAVSSAGAVAGWDKDCQDAVGPASYCKYYQTPAVCQGSMVACGEVTTASPTSSRPTGSTSTTTTGTSTVTTSVATTAAPTPSGSVVIENGPITGKTIKNNLKKEQPIIQDVQGFFGIPFASPPVGSLRFKAPQPFTESWDSPKKMTKKQSECIQSTGKGSEDCLYLNVYRPASATTATKLPVMLYIFGGGFVNGDGSGYDGTVLAAEHSSIVVAINYRLGHLGFFGSEASFAQEGTTGNWGTLDQQFAMKWVQSNIGAFGGDSDRVMIFGESAGAFSVMWHIAAPGSAGLFHSAIMESGTSHTGVFFQQRDDAFQYYQWVATELGGCSGADDLECLRAVDASKLNIPSGIRFDELRAPQWASPLFPMMPVGPIIDGVALTGPPAEVVKAGQHNAVPMIAGVNRGEGTGFILALTGLVPNIPALPTVESVKTTINYMLQDEAATEEAMALYPSENFSAKYGEENKGFEMASEMIRDAIFHCPARLLASNVHQANGEAYVYSFDMDPLFPEWIGDINTGDIPMFGFGNLTVNMAGSFHTAEIPLVWKSFSDRKASILRPSIYDLYMGHPPREQGDSFHVLSDQMTCMWASMAASGVPVGGDAVCPAQPELTNWPTFLESADAPLGQYLHLGTSLEVRDLREANVYPDTEFPNAEVCQFWDSHPIVFHNLKADLGSEEPSTILV